MKKLIIAAVGSGILLLSACSHDTKDFKENAEDFIESAKVETQAETTFSDTTCTEPAKVEAGETFTCVTTDVDGNVWDFDLVIQSKDSYEVTDGVSFTKEIEDFIEGSEVATQAATTFTEADCATPDTREIGDVVTCTAVDASGVTWDFTVTITDTKAFEITTGEPRA